MGSLLVDRATAEFGVEKRKLYLSDGVEVKEHRAITRSDNGGLLGIVGKDYQVVPHKDVLAAFDEVDILKGDKLDVCDEGGIMFASYDIKNNGGVSMSEVQKGDVVSWKIRVFNSYNQRYGVGFELIANRLVCTNGLVVPKAISRLSLRHFASVNVSRFKELIGVRMGQIEPTVNRWQAWTKTHTTEPVIKQFFDGIRKDRLGDTDREKLFKESLVENEKLGVWGIYNVFTKHITHDLKVRNEKNRMMVVRGREQAILQRFYKYDWAAR